MPFFFFFFSLSFSFFLVHSKTHQTLNSFYCWWICCHLSRNWIMSEREEKQRAREREKGSGERGDKSRKKKKKKFDRDESIKLKVLSTHWILFLFVKLISFWVQQKSMLDTKKKRTRWKTLGGDDICGPIFWAENHDFQFQHEMFVWRKICIQSKSFTFKCEFLLIESVSHTFNSCQKFQCEIQNFFSAQFFNYSFSLSSL